MGLLVRLSDADVLSVLIGNLFTSLMAILQKFNYPTAANLILADEFYSFGDLSFVFNFFSLCCLSVLNTVLYCGKN